MFATAGLPSCERVIGGGWMVVDDPLSPDTPFELDYRAIRFVRRKPEGGTTAEIAAALAMSWHAVDRAERSAERKFRGIDEVATVVELGDVDGVARLLQVHQLCVRLETAAETLRTYYAADGSSAPMREADRLARAARSRRPRRRAEVGLDFDRWRRDCDCDLEAAVCMIWSKLL